MSLIPGTVGAAPVQNIGAYGMEAKETVQKVDTIYTKNVNWIRFKTPGEMSLGAWVLLNGGTDAIFEEDVSGFVGFESFTMTTWACIEVGAGFVDTNDTNDCSPESLNITIWYPPPGP